MTTPVLLPLIPLRDTVVFPRLVVPLLIGRERSLAALEEALATDEQQIVLLAQKDGDIDDPVSKQLFRIGTLAKIHQVMRLPDESIKILVEGQTRVQIDRFRRRQPGFQAYITPIDIDLKAKSAKQEKRLDVLQRLLRDEFAEYVSGHPKLPNAAYESVQDIDNPIHLADLIASFLPIELDRKQELLSQTHIFDLQMQVSQLLHVQ
ncbi:MAG: LON peptidase substrate-binding domain-containing protein, partial [Cyanobacteria bacterium J06555_12]